MRLQEGEMSVEEQAQEEADRFDDDQPASTYMVVPPDGGWGWVVAAASFLCNLVVDGIIFSFGMFLLPVAESLGVPQSSVAIVGSLLAGFYCMSGPFVSALANRYGFRVVTILGSILGAISFVASYLATSVTFLWISYGVIGGIGFSLIYVPAVITVGFYFERWRALATGIAVCGSGIGTAVMAPITTLLIENYGWRGALLIQAGLILNCCIFGAMFRPIKPTRVQVPQIKESESTTAPLLQRIKVARDKQMQSSGSLIGSGLSLPGDDKSHSRKKIFAGINNNQYPSIADMIAGSNPILMSHKAYRRQSSQSLNVSLYSNSMSKAQKRLSVPLYSDADIVAAKKSANGIVIDGSTGHKIDSSEHVTSTRGSRVRTVSEGSRRSSSKEAVGVRPLYRDDIFFGGSLARLPEYEQNKDDPMTYHMSVQRIPTKEDIEEEMTSKCICCPQSVQRTLATMLDFSLFTSPTFFVLAIAGFFTMMGFYVPFMYVTDRAKMNGMDEATARWLVSAMGITNTVARIGCGLLTSIPGIDALLVNNIALTMGAVATIFSGLSNSSEFVYTYVCLYGIATACFASLRSIIIVDLLGLDKLTNAFGLLLLFQGIGATIGTPVAAAVMESTQNYDMSFYMSGAIVLLSAVMCYPLKRINIWEKKSKKAKESGVLA